MALAFTRQCGLHTANTASQSRSATQSRACASAKLTTPFLSRSQRTCAVETPTSAALRHNGLSRRHLEVCHAVRADQQSEGLDTATLKLISDISSGVDERLRAVAISSLEALSAAEVAPNSDLRSKVHASIAKLSKGLLERETEVRLLLLAALCGEHMLLLGPPGTAKSELSRRLSSLCKGRYFERLLTRFSVPEELFGPLSMRGLEDDKYVRQIDGYLPTAEVAFIDEIFKANSAILNALLTLLNERLFDNGNERLEAPLLCLVGASNELPESEELDALYDRFLIRKQVAQVSNAQIYKLAILASGRPLPTDATTNGSSATAEDTTPAQELSMDDFRTTGLQAYQDVDMPMEVIDILVSVRNYLQDKCEPPIYVSDRRFMKAVQMLQVAAHADGRTQVNEYDLLLLEYVFGNRPDDSTKVRAHVLDTIASDPGLQQAELLFLGLFGRACRVLEAGAADEIAETEAETSTLVQLLSDRHRALVYALEGQYPDLRQTTWQSETSQQAAVQALTPQMTENKKKVEDLLREALTLQSCLSQKTTADLLERLLPKRYKQYQKGISGKA